MSDDKATGHLMEKAEIEQMHVTITQQATELGEQDSRIEVLEAALHRIVQWADAYPTEIFPEVDAEYHSRARKALEADGMTLDRLNASAMRHVVQGVGKIAKEALR